MSYVERGVARLASLAIGTCMALLFAAEAEAQLAAPTAPWEIAPLSVQDQLDEDLTVVAPGLGALFVPTLSSPELEPGVVVFSGADRVASSPTGKRIPLPPGVYRLSVGSGPQAQRGSADVTVSAGITTPVAPFFAGLRLSIVDEKERPIDGRYTVVGADGTQVLEADFDAEAASQPTWLLAPGQYYLSLGGAPHERVALSVHAGEVLRYRLVVDNGSVVGTAFGEPRPIAPSDGLWTLRWIVGGTGAFDRRKNAVTGFNGDMLMLEIFAKATVGIEKSNHVARLNIFVDQAFGGIENTNGADSPFQWLTSRSEAEALYQYKILGSPLAPYVRVIGRTSLAPTRFLPAEDVSVVTRNPAGTVISTQAQGRGDKVRLLRTFAPLSLQEGAGLGLSLLDNEIATLEFRAGGALRQANYRRGTYLEDVDGGVINLRRFKNNRRYGAEVTGLLELRLSRTFTVQSHFDSFAPHQQITRDEAFKPVFYWDNTVAIRIADFASVIYDVSMSRPEVVLPQTTVTSGLALRLQHVSF